MTSVTSQQMALVEITVRSEPGFGDVDLVLADAAGESVLASSLTYDPTEKVSWITAGATELLVEALLQQNSDLVSDGAEAVG